MNNCSQLTTHSSDDAAKALRILTRSTEPVPAAAMAARLGFAGCRESMRRRVRAVVTHLRNSCGVMVIGSQAGYFVTEDEKLWQQYLDGRQIDAKKVLGVTGRQKRMVTDSAGQGLLFVPGTGCMGNEQFAGR